MYFPVLFIVSLISALTCGVLDIWQGTKDNYSEWVILYQETVAFHKREVYCHKRKWDQQSLIDLYKQLTVHESLQCLVRAQYFTLSQFKAQIENTVHAVHYK